MPEHNTEKAKRLYLAMVDCLDYKESSDAIIKLIALPHIYDPRILDFHARKDAKEYKEQADCLTTLFRAILSGYNAANEMPQHAKLGPERVVIEEKSISDVCGICTQEEWGYEQGMYDK